MAGYDTIRLGRVGAAPGIRGWEMLRSFRGRILLWMGAALASLLLVVPLAAADPPTPTPTPPKTSADRAWTVEPVADGWRVTWRSPTPVPLRDDLPVLVADGRRIGLAQPSADGRTFTTSTRDAR